MRKKIFYCLLGIVSGIGLFINFETMSLLNVIVICGISAGFLCIFDKKYMVIPLGILLGFTLSFFNFRTYKLKDYNEITAHITILEKRKTADNYRYFVRVKANNIDEKSVLFAKEDLDIGDIFLVDADISIADKNTNPNLFSYRNYLISKGIGSQLEIKEVYKSYQSKSIFLKARNKFYKYIHQTFDQNLSKTASDFIISVILGENLIENTDIKDLGLVHILAVSGLHIDLLLSFILFILAKFNYKYGYGLALGLCLFYGYLIGFPFSVIRVLIINLIGFLAFIFAMPEDKIKSLLIAGILILLRNPFALLNSGYILSFVATSAVYLIYPKIKNRIAKKTLMENLAFTGSIQVGLLPFTIFYYGKINLLSILANFLVLPIFTIAMYLAFGLVIFYPILRFLLSPFFKVLDFLLLTILNIVKFLNSFSLFNIRFAHPSIFVTIYLFVLILLIFYMRRSNKKLLKLFYGINLIVVTCSLCYDYLNPEISFTMIDIGQGDAFLLKDRGDYYLFDVGGPKYDNYDSGERILIPYLNSLGIRNIKAVFISHEDGDHAGNIGSVVDNFNVENIMTSKLNTKSLATYNPKIIKKDDRIKIRDGSITCIFDGVEGEENAESVGYIIEIKGIKILTLGDLPSEYEDDLNIKADVLKVSHHGSRTSTSRDFVEKVDPQIALISAGRNNKYGHPTREVLENLDGVKIYNSQINGMVKINFKEQVSVESYVKGGYFR
ncbi:DNA internalization-related competence protein ComEC/Rec2 [Anaerococcus urinomassiliensis]|uniref:DNA internalization-related competence protein ComEC/Rec2 n=1 Tax=Anaerococcus urinomassiliensis TaxID=1745712 RepID=UPI0009402A8B|nr:DNA internalization-related competence protein ComEC/Rec2 [Anaerococcus urinomassiliensis]